MTKHLRLLILAVALSTFTTTAGGSVASLTSKITHRHVHAKAHGHPRHHVRHRRHPRREVAHHGRRALYGVSPRMMAMAERVSMCEEGGDWRFVGTVFDGGLGWTLANWAHFRRPTWPSRMHDAPPHMQANALFRFVHYYGIAMPDQQGCTGGY